MHIKKTIVFIIFFVISFFYSQIIFATEDIQPKFEKILVGFYLPDPFEYTTVNIKLKKSGSLDFLLAKYKTYNVLIDVEKMSAYKAIDLNSIGIYEGIPEEVLPKNTKITSFSLCLNYGEYKQGYRLNAKGYYRDVLEVIMYPDGTYELQPYPVATQNVPVSPCW